MEQISLSGVVVMTLGHVIKYSSLIQVSKVGTAVLRYYMVIELMHV